MRRLSRKKSTSQKGKNNELKPTAINISNFNFARDNLLATYESEQKKYIQDKIDEIINGTTN